MKEHQAGGKARQNALLSAGTVSTPQTLRGGESGHNLRCKTAEGLRAYITKKTLTMFSFFHFFFVVVKPDWPTFVGKAHANNHLRVFGCVWPQLTRAQHKKTSWRRYTTTRTPSFITQRWQGKDRTRRDTVYSASSSPARDIFHRRVTLAVPEISGEPWLKRPACILR